MVSVVRYLTGNRNSDGRAPASLVSSTLSCCGCRPSCSGGGSVSGPYQETGPVGSHFPLARRTSGRTENHFWVSTNNSQARPSRWASFAVRPDGQIVGRLTLHRPGALLTEMHIGQGLFFDAPGLWRESTLAGQLHSGQLVTDPRSADLTSL